LQNRVFGEADFLVRTLSLRFNSIAFRAQDGPCGLCGLVACGPAWAPSGQDHMEPARQWENPEEQTGVRECGVPEATFMSNRVLAAVPHSTIVPPCDHGLLDLSKMLAELRHELEQLNHAIVVLQRISLGQGKRRGRSPKWMTGTTPPARTERKRRTLNPESRARISAAVRKGWAKERKAEAGS
jgi:hypothetical protein